MNEPFKEVAEPCFNVLIVGAGQIGAFYDQPGDQDVLSHGHAFSKHPRFNLLGFVDQDRTKSGRAAAIWGGRPFDTLEQALAEERVDVVCLAVPDELHFEYLKKLATSEVRLIFTEKPLTRTWPQALAVRQLFAEATRPAVAVNYMRRFVPEFAEIRRRIGQNELGRLLGGTGYYGKGLVHNGSHLIDLLRFLLGEVGQVQFLSEEYDYYDDDPSISGQISFSGGGRAVLQAVDCRPYSVFELDLLFENKRLRILDSGFALEESDAKEDLLFPGYRRLESSPIRATSLGVAMYYAVENIYGYLTDHKALACSLEDGFRVMEVCQRLKEGIRDEKDFAAGP